MRKFIKRFSAITLCIMLALGILQSSFIFHPESVHAAAAGYTDYGHSWNPSGKNDTCSGCGGTGTTTMSAYTTTKCTTCNGLGFYQSTAAGETAGVDSSTGKYTIWYIGCNNCGGSGKQRTVYTGTTPSGESTTTSFLFVKGSGYKGTCSHCNGKGVNYCCTNSGCKYSGYDNWESESGYTSICYTKANEYKITFNANGGTNGSVSSVTTTYGQTWYYIQQAAIPSRTGYTFTGYYDSTSGGTQVYQSNGYAKAGTKYWNSSNQWVYTGNVTAYARWSANSYTIKFSGNGATSGSTANIAATYDKTHTLTANGYVRPGYTFLGWSTNASATTPTYTDKQSVSNLTATNGGTVTLYAIWKANTYYVSYDGYYSDVIGSMTNSTHTYNVASPLNANQFIRPGYTFTGWHYYPGSTTGVLTDKQSVTTLTTTNEYTVPLFAAWLPNQYTVTLNPNNGDASWTEEVTFDAEYGEAFKDLEREGYDFGGWKDTDGNIITTDTIVKTAGNHNLTAAWIPHKHNVYYDLNGGGALEEGTTTPVVYEYGTAINLGITATRDGYTFIGWAKAPGISKIVSSYTMPDEDVTLYAQWTLETSGLQKALLAVGTSSDDAVYIPIPQSEDRPDGSTYVLNGLNVLTHYSDANNSATKFYVFVYDNAENYTTYPLTRTPNPNPPITGLPDILPPVTYTQTVKHMFYHVANDEYDTKYVLTESIEGGYKYVPSILPYTINGETYQLPEGYASSYVIENPYGQAGEYTVSENGATTIKYQPNFYTLTLNANGGQFNDDNTSKTKTVQYTSLYGELEPPKDREGYNFTGWYKTPECIGNPVLPSDVYETIGDVTLYAGWAPQYFTLTFDYTTNGGDSFNRGNQTTITVLYGASIDLNAYVAGKTDFQFNGWSENSKDILGMPNNGTVSFSMPAHDVTLYALFSKECTLTFYQEGSPSPIIKQGTMYNNDLSVSIDYPAISQYGNWDSIEWDAVNGENLSADGGVVYAEGDDVYYATYEKKVTAQFKTPEDVIPVGDVEATLYLKTGEEQTTYTVELPTPNRNGYSFTGWECSNGQVYKISEKPAGAWKIIFTDSVILESMWDKCPTINASDRYFTLEDAKNGQITEENLLLSVTAWDEEDGYITDTKLSIPNYDANEFTLLTSDATIALIYRVVDSFGNEASTKANVYVVNSIAQETEISKEARFIESDYLYTSNIDTDMDGDGYVDGKGNDVNFGGLRATSLWKTNALYKTSLDNALENRETKTASENRIYVFTPQDIKEAQQYVKDYGFADFLSDLGRNNFISIFLRKE